MEKINEFIEQTNYFIFIPKCWQKIQGPTRKRRSTGNIQHFHEQLIFQFIQISFWSLKVIFFVILANYILVKQGSDIKGCKDQRKTVGEERENLKGKDDATKLQMCADAVKADSSCGDFFFYRSSKGFCHCEKIGASCEREFNPLYNEYTFGMSKHMTDIQSQIIALYCS